MAAWVRQPCKGKTARTSPHVKLTWSHEVVQCSLTDKDIMETGGINLLVKILHTCDFKAVFIQLKLHFLHLLLFLWDMNAELYYRDKSSLCLNESFWSGWSFSDVCCLVSNVFLLIWTGPSFDIDLRSDTSSVYPWDTAVMKCLLSASGSSPKTGKAHTCVQVACSCFLSLAHTQKCWFCRW